MPRVKTLSRRHVLRGLSGAALSLPFLELMTAGRARADALRNPQRLFFFVTPNGALSLDRQSDSAAPNSKERYFPVKSTSGGAPTLTDWALNAEMRDDNGYALEPGASLQNYKSKLTVLDGIDQVASLQTNGHAEGMAACLTARRPLSEAQGFMATGVSIDKDIARVLKATQTNLPRNLALAATIGGSAGTYGSVSWDAAQTRSNLLDDPKALWRALFSDALPPAAGEDRRRRQLALLDDVRSDYLALKPRLGSADRQRLDRHLTAIEELERRVGATARVCTAPSQPTNAQNSPDNAFPAATRVVLDMVALAFSCDLSRIITLMMRTEGGTVRWTLPWLGLPCNQQGDQCLSDTLNHHEMSHATGDPTILGHMVKAGQWHFAQFAYLMHKLAQIDEGGSSVLDNSLLIQTSGIARGNHSLNRAPYLLAGSLGGKLKTGQLLRFNGATHNQLFLSLHHAMGDSALATFGDPSRCPGPLPGLAA